MRIWDEVNYQYIEAEIVWDGRGPIPGMGDGFQRHASYLAQTPAINAAHVSSRVRTKCRCGRRMILVADSKYTTCKVCRGCPVGRPRGGMQNFCSTGCGRAVGLNYKRCRKCRDGHRKSRPLTREAA
jgi:hypothetical protein